MEEKDITKKLLFIGLIFVLIIVMLGGCNSGGSSPTKEQNVIVTEKNIRAVAHFTNSDGLHLVSDLSGILNDNFPYHPSIDSYQVYGYLLNVTNNTIQHV